MAAQIEKEERLDKIIELLWVVVEHAHEQRAKPQ